MGLSDLVQHVRARARFSAAGLAKLDCFRSDRLLLGLNCLEPGQEQSVHTHAGADKFYFVVSGKARFRVGSDVFDTESGDLVLAPAGLEHGVERAFERTILLVGIAPAPPARGAS